MKRQKHKGDTHERKIPLMLNLDPEILKKRLFSWLALFPRLVATVCDGCVLMLGGALGLALMGLRPGMAAWNLATLYVVGFVFLGGLQQSLQRSPGQWVLGLQLQFPEEDRLLQHLRLLLRHIVKWGALGLCLYTAFQWFFPQQTGLPQGQLHTGMNGIRLLYSFFLFALFNALPFLGFQSKAGPVAGTDPAQPGQERRSASDLVAGTSIGLAFGRRMAVRSGVLGACCLPGVWLVLGLFPEAQQSNPTARSYQESFLRDNMRSLQTTLEIYARDHDGIYPESVERLYEVAQRESERYQSYWQPIENPVNGRRGPQQAFGNQGIDRPGAVRYQVWKNRSGQYTQYALYALDHSGQLLRHHGQVFSLSNAD